MAKRKSKKATRVATDVGPIETPGPDLGDRDDGDRRQRVRFDPRSAHPLLRRRNRTGERCGSDRIGERCGADLRGEVEKLTPDT